MLRLSRNLPVRLNNTEICMFIKLWDQDRDVCQDVEGIWGGCRRSSPVPRCLFFIPSSSVVRGQQTSPIILCTLCVCVLLCLTQTTCEVNLRQMLVLGKHCVPECGPRTGGFLVAEMDKEIGRGGVGEIMEWGQTHMAARDYTNCFSPFQPWVAASLSGLDSCTDKRSHSCLLSICPGNLLWLKAVMVLVVLVAVAGGESCTKMRSTLQKFLRYYGAAQHAVVVRSDPWNRTQSELLRCQSSFPWFTGCRS